MLNIASLFEPYMLGEELSQSCVVLFHFLTTYFAPKLGVVVLIQTLPVGLVYVSLILYSGMLVCFAIVNAGG